MRGQLVRLLSMLLAAALSGCAELPKTMYLDSGKHRPEQAAQVWPRAGSLPRFAYAGELLGEPNFRASPDVKESAGRQLLAWIVGLTHGNSAPQRVLQRPQGGAVDAAGRIYISDVSRQAVFVFDSQAGDLMIWEWADESKRFRSPIGVAVKSNGEVLVADAELGRVVRLATDGRPIGSIGDGLLVRPTGIALDQQQGLLYVADTRANEIKIFDSEGVMRRRFGAGGDGAGQLNSPTYLAVAKDRVYVTDTLNARVQVFDTDGQFVSTFGKRGLYLGDFTLPKGIAVSSSDGLVYVVESHYDYLLVFDLQGNFLMPIGGSGRETGQFVLPAGTWVDQQGRVYVADMLNGRVSIFQFLGADS
ncbi:MAG: 6-bladed beta-propeller [Gammaproteobacteria bacterium]|nr:6-bladed beta-propeller [Gammaproteobacteria bacterium]